MPPSPFDDFIDSVRRSLEKSARDLLKDLNREARANIRAYGRASRQAAKPLPGPKKRATGRREAGEPPLPTRTRASLYYDALEVSPHASIETISAAFRSLSSRYHPDNKKTGDAERYKFITEAWSILKDPVKRKRYDRQIGIEKINT